ncbi:hypothetical protein HXX76_000727 [Chlamydomonas incerta]|uniref:EGF-like domain-containing protein n=1 Tax=Chlamydomonas incerta TaxID=51695 RepID=A0A835WFG4_CHLIN|nr:hypothetical protein HXX76_000727 [Chlamydomonas incerta]|eukprot:KAG2446130.1 hypothetical protein HXX76_000727 [Chlamydomonas incerta]
MCERSNDLRSRTCTCNAFWTGANCETDVDECGANNGGCSANAVCTNNEGASPTCACNQGYLGNGLTCTGTKLPAGLAPTSAHFDGAWLGPAGNGSAVTSWPPTTYAATQPLTLKGTCRYDNVTGSLILDGTTCYGHSVSSLINWGTATTSAFTIVTIYKLSPTRPITTPQALVALSRIPSNKFKALLYRNDALSITFASGGGSKTSAPAVLVATNFWNFDAVVRDSGGTTGTIYRSQVPSATTYQPTLGIAKQLLSSLALGIDGDNLVVGADISTSGSLSWALLGNIACVLVYNRSLTKIELTSVYQAYAPRFFPGADPCAASPCLNGGTCEHSNDLSSRTCLCDDFWTGANCETDECGASGANNGGCSANAVCANNEGAPPTCACEKGYMGDGITCTVDPCEPSPCLNGGMCERSNDLRSRTCTCNAFWTGANCETDVDECGANNGGCSANAVCTNNEGASPTCACNQGYLGNGLTCTVPTLTAPGLIGPAGNGSAVTSWPPTTYAATQPLTLKGTCSYDNVTGSLILDGTTCYGRCASGLINWGTATTSAFTIVTIYKLSSTAARQTLVSTANMASQFKNYLLYFSDNMFEFGDFVTAGYTFIGKQGNPTANSWTFDAMVRDSGGATGAIYRSQTAATTTTYQTSLAIAQQLSGKAVRIYGDYLLVGVDIRSTTSGWFAGNIGCVLVYNRSLTKTELTSVYQAYAPRFFPGADPCDPSPCLNGGTCERSIDLSSRTCACNAFWTGANCDTDVDECADTYTVDPCAASPCLNGGTCERSNDLSSRTCLCDDFWTGANCETDVDECGTNNGGCSANAGCTNNNGALATCACKTGYVGDGITCTASPATSDGG